MNTTEFKKLIPLYLEDMLSDSQKEAFEAYLSRSKAAKDEFALYEKSWEFLGEWEDVEPQPNYMSRFWTELSVRTSWYEKIYVSIRENLLDRSMVAPAFVTACLVLVMGVLSLHNYRQIQKSDQILANMSVDELEVVENIDLVKDYDIIEDIDFLADLEIIENIENIDISET